MTGYLLGLLVTVAGLVVLFAGGDTWVYWTLIVVGLVFTAAGWAGNR